MRVIQISHVATQPDAEAQASDGAGVGEGLDAGVEGREVGGAHGDGAEGEEDGEGRGHQDAVGGAEDAASGGRRGDGAEAAGVVLEGRLGGGGLGAIVGLRGAVEDGEEGRKSSCRSETWIGGFRACYSLLVFSSVIWRV